MAIPETETAIAALLGKNAHDAVTDFVVQTGRIETDVIPA